MTAPTQTPKEQVDAYMARLSRVLDGLPASDVNDILQELSGHVAERAAASGAQPDNTTMARILSHLGTPEEIGSLYRADVLVAHARTTFSPMLIVRTTIRLATRTILGFMAFLVGILGYGIGLPLIACAVLKPFFPNNIGLWVHPRGIELATPYVGKFGPDLLGWWIIPISLFVGVLFVVGTTMGLRWMLRFAPRASHRLSTSI